jgi:hypothetical protein
MLFYQLVEIDTDTGVRHDLRLYLNKESPPWVSARGKVLEGGAVDANTPHHIRDWMKLGQHVSLHLPGCNCGCRCA